MIPSHSRSQSGRTRLTLLQVPMVLFRTCQRRERRLQQVLVQSSSLHRVLVLSSPVVLLPPQVGEVQWQGS